ncbi:hypothetical protein EDE12_11959 [Methylosinus sp. sav-2]|uniref:hypothetical protein n=1 Tax=Methylosinus sp. sav-2 TaxID=2485168 RepID=UPI001064CA7D|nr:hypothetical protein [Methylosinus sp. sav-2]TDX60618.1 hypothetical protein EDE12_11959 [Methylosinus sp. sav-2]
MTSLLTLNGIPPRILGSLTEEQRKVVASYASSDRRESYNDWWQNGVPEPIRPFAKFVSGAAISFIRWGATILENNRIGVISSQVGIGQSTFGGLDTNLHSDMRGASEQLREERIICLRLLCVSSAAATFIDLTDQENIESILDSHRIDDGRIYKTELLSLSQKNGYAVSPKPWDVIVFDANTPHIPPGALQSNRRVFQQAWIEIQLPPDWRPRLRSDNRPLFMFPDF